MKILIDLTSLIIFNVIFNLVNIYQANQPDLLVLILSGCQVCLLQLGLLIVINEKYHLGIIIVILSNIISMINSYFEKIPMIFFQNIFIIVINIIGLYFWYKKPIYRENRFRHYGVILLTSIIIFGFIFAIFDSFGAMLNLKRIESLEEKSLSVLYYSFSVIPFVFLSFRFYHSHYLFLIGYTVNIMIGYFIKLPLHYLLLNSIIIFNLPSFLLQRKIDEKIETNNPMENIDV